ncbi:hypothetical protein Tco_0539364 [Tanacetum coccineum]
MLTILQLEVDDNDDEEGSSEDDEMDIDKYGFMKNHNKTVKNKQARTRERKSEQKPEAKPGKVKPSVKMVKSWSTKVNKTHNIPFSPSKFH